MEDNGADDDDDEKKKEEEEDKDKEDKEEKEEKEEEKDDERELSLLLSKCHAALKRARETVAEASVMRFDDDDDDDDDVDTRKNFAAAAALKTDDDDDDGQKRTREMMMHSMAGRVERMVEECKETLEEIERKTTHLSTKTYRGGGDADAKEEKERRRQEFVRAMRTETRTMRRDVEEVLKHAESARKGERRQLIPEPMKEAPKTKDETREEKIQQQQQRHQPEDGFLFWKTSAKTYLRKAKKKMDSVATQTKNAVKKYARSKSYDDAEGQQKETERYSDAQRQREMREEEEIRRMRRYGYESTNARSREDEHLEENVDKDDEDAQRRALFAKIAPTITPTPSTSSSLPNNATTAKNSYDINAARNSTLSANRSAIALENSLHHAERAERAGRDTLENLRRQRETLQRTSGHVQSATRTADENAKLVKKMSHWSRLGC